MLVAISLRVLNTREFLLITQVIRWLRLFEVMPLNSEMRIMVGRRRIMKLLQTMYRMKPKMFMYLKWIQVGKWN